MFVVSRTRELLSHRAVNLHRTHAAPRSPLGQIQVAGDCQPEHLPDPVP